MKHWVKENVLLGKGSRSPRDSANFRHKEEQTAKRQLELLNGGDTSAVTHRETPRRGSRLRKGEVRSSRRAGRHQCRQEGEGDWQEAVVDLNEYRRAHASPSTAPASPVQSTTAPDTTGSPPTPPADAQPFHIWSAGDFSPEAIERDKARWKQQQPSHEEARAFRSQMEADFERKRQQDIDMVKKLMGRGKQPSPPTPILPDSSDCVHHLNFDPEGACPAFSSPSPRPVIQGSHIRPTSSSRKRGNKAKSSA